LDSEHPVESTFALYGAIVAMGARARLPTRLRVPAYRAFARATGADLGEAELPLGSYPSLGDLFARRLRSGVRTVDPSPDALIAPCDGVVASCGSADGAMLVQAKGHSYSIDELVVDDTRAPALHGGSYMTIYLSPRDYHRVHAPFDARLVGYDHVPGALWPVNPKVAARRDRLFTRNERVVIWLESRVGLCALVMIAASGVGNIELAHCGSFGDRHERRRVELERDNDVRRGDELGAFHLGSTVVLVLQPGAGHCDGAEGQVVRFGERLGALS
jgi:phosphatidylserine decarboxylase